MSRAFVCSLRVYAKSPTSDTDSDPTSFIRHPTPEIRLPSSVSPLQLTALQQETAQPNKTMSFLRELEGVERQQNVGRVALFKESTVHAIAIAENALEFSAHNHCCFSHVFSLVLVLLLCAALSAPSNDPQPTNNDQRAASRSRSKSKSPAPASPVRVHSASPSPDRDRAHHRDNDDQQQQQLSSPLNLANDKIYRECASIIKSRLLRVCEEVYDSSSSSTSDGSSRESMLDFIIKRTPPDLSTISFILSVEKQYDIVFPSSGSSSFILSSSSSSDAHRSELDFQNPALDPLHIDTHQRAVVHIKMIVMTCNCQNHCHHHHHHHLLKKDEVDSSRRSHDHRGRSSHRSHRRSKSRSRSRSPRKHRKSHSSSRRRSHSRSSSRRRHSSSSSRSRSCDSSPLRPSLSVPDPLQPDFKPLSNKNMKELEKGNFVHFNKLIRQLALSSNPADNRRETRLGDDLVPLHLIVQKLELLIHNLIGSKFIFLPFCLQWHNKLYQLIHYDAQTLATTLQQHICYALHAVTLFRQHPSSFSQVFKYLESHRETLVTQQSNVAVPNALLLQNLHQRIMSHQNSSATHSHSRSTASLHHHPLQPLQHHHQMLVQTKNMHMIIAATSTHVKVANTAAHATNHTFVANVNQLHTTKLLALLSNKNKQVRSK